MGRISGRDLIKKAIKEFAGNGVGYLQLKEDGSTKRVRFLHTDDNDLDVYVVHEVEVDDRTVNVECLQNESCPLCVVSKPRVKVFLSAYDPEDDKVVIWERGPAIIDDIFGFIGKYGHLNNRLYEIKRHGKKGDQKTKYQMFPEDKSEPVDNHGEPLKPRQDIIARGVVKVWSKEEMELHAAQVAEQSATTEKRNRGGSGRRGPGF